MKPTIRFEKASQKGSVTRRGWSRWPWPLAAHVEAHPDSDVNLSLYYRSDRPLTIAKLRRLGPGLEDRHLPYLVTKTGERVPWINGCC